MYTKWFVLIYSTDVKEGYMREMRQFLEDQLNVVKKDLGYPEDVA